MEKANFYTTGGGITVEGQNAVTRWLNSEVLAGQTTLVNDLLKRGAVNFEDIENFYTDNSAAISELQEQLENLQFSDAYINGQQAALDEAENLQDRIDELEREQDEPQEIFEWYLVSGWFADKLREQGEPILEAHNNQWWGRCCTGQWLGMDYTITKIADEYGVADFTRH